MRYGILKMVAGVLLGAGPVEYDALAELRVSTGRMSFVRDGDRQWIQLVPEVTAEGDLGIWRNTYLRDGDRVMTLDEERNVVWRVTRDWLAAGVGFCRLFYRSFLLADSIFGRASGRSLGGS